MLVRILVQFDDYSLSSKAWEEVLISVDFIEHNFCLI